MFNHLTNQQNLADSIKGLLQAAEPIARAQKPGQSGSGISRQFRRAYDLLTRFERAGWIPLDYSRKCSTIMRLASLC